MIDFAYTRAYAIESDPLSKARIRAVLHEEFGHYQDALLTQDTPGLVNRIQTHTHERSIFYFELHIKPAMRKSATAFPANIIRHHFNRDPFLKMLEYAAYLDPSDLDLTYEIGDIKLNYNRREAIFFLKITGRGSILEPLSGQHLSYDISQECRNTISAYAPTYMRYDSIACRMTITYHPFNQAQQTVIENAVQFHLSPEAGPIQEPTTEHNPHPFPQSKPSSHAIAYEEQMTPLPDTASER